MGLTTGRGPLSPDPAGWFHPPVPSGPVYVEPHPRLVEAFVDGRAVLATERALLVHRPGQPGCFAFPLDVVGDLPAHAVAEAPGHVQVPWDAVDRWVEEGRELVAYPPSPYHRVDCRPTTRRLRVDVDDTCVVDTTETVIVFETTLAPRLYVSHDAVRAGVLHRSETTSYCNYKGVATYWSATVGGRQIPDAAWSYDDPLDESRAIAGLVSFDPDRVTVVAQLPPAPRPTG